MNRLRARAMRAFELLSAVLAAPVSKTSKRLGMVSMIRIPNASRTTVLQACECGPDIIDLPMANSPDMVAEFVENARFPPQGVRGFFSVSRSVNYGLTGSVCEEQQKLNRELCLMVQVETKEALDCVEELCRVPGLDAIFVGPADLSASLGVPGQTGHAVVHEAATHVVRTAKKHGKL